MSMVVQLVGKPVEVVEKVPDLALFDMMKRQIEFQRVAGRWDPKLEQPGQYSRADMFFHMMDMAAQECSEAWDLLEGGWKHHKRKPSPANRDEVIGELVDVMHFLVNAYLFMGGKPSQIALATAVSANQMGIAVPSMDFEMVYNMGTRSMAANRSKIEALYGFGDGAHGEAWVKRVATSVNYLRSKITRTVEIVRDFSENLPRAQRAHDAFPARPGFVVIETWPWVMAAFADIPDATPELFFSSYMHKSDINFERQRSGY
jgi:dUTPase